MERPMEQETEASCQEPGEWTILEADPLAPVKLSDDYDFRWYLIIISRHPNHPAKPLPNS